jgi:Fe-S-cluster containining protein
MNKETLYETLAGFKKYSLLGWFRYFRMKIQGKKVEVHGSCRLCGKCCRKISLEAAGRWLRKEADFAKVVKKYPEYERFTIVGRDLQGFLLFTCSWFSPEGICKDHENRLSICSDFPNVTLYFTGGEVPMGCGYAFKEVVPFSSILQKEIIAADEKKKSNTDS